MTEWRFGRFRFWTNYPHECQICQGGHLHVKWEGVGWLCATHSLDWMFDDYQSNHDYDSIDELRITCSSEAGDSNE